MKVLKDTNRQMVMVVRILSSIFKELDPVLSDTGSLFPPKGLDCVGFIRMMPDEYVEVYRAIVCFLQNLVHSKLLHLDDFHGSAFWEKVVCSHFIGTPRFLSSRMYQEDYREQKEMLSSLWSRCALLQYSFSRIQTTANLVMGIPIALAIHTEYLNTSPKVSRKTLSVWSDIESIALNTLDNVIVDSHYDYQMAVSTTNAFFTEAIRGYNAMLDGKGWLDVI